MLWLKFTSLPLATKQYILITFNYWAFTLTDGALRMLVLLYFHQLGYSPLAIAMLFLFYEVFGVVTNLVGGWLGARIGLNKTMNIGLLLQVFALLMLALPEHYLSVLWVMSAQALSGIAKDLNKMSAKSSIKTLVPANKNSVLFKWIALLTGSKNALKGLGFFLGALLLATIGFRAAMLLMASVLAVVVVLSLFMLRSGLGKASNKPKFTQIFSKSASLNYLSMSRLCLFAARDVWFVVALPVYLSTELQWQYESIGGFMALWIVVYGIVQASSPSIVGRANKELPNASMLFFWGILLSAVTLVIVLLLNLEINAQWSIIIGLFVFGSVFAVNSALHSYVIVAMAKNDGVSMDVGFYYMANALGRLLGTVLSGWLYQAYNLPMCLLFSAALAFISAIFIRKI